MVQAFRSRYFTAMKMAPDLAANISKMNGLPICQMTSQTYVAPSGLEGQSGKAVLDGLKAEIQKLVNAAHLGRVQPAAQRLVSEPLDGTDGRVVL